MLALALSVPVGVAAQATPAGTRISNRAAFSAVDPSGTPVQGLSEPAVVEVARVAGVRLEPPRSVETRPGETVVFAHTLRNLGNAEDRFALTSQFPAGWLVRLYLDTNGDGLLDPGDLPVSGPVTLGPGAAAKLLAAVNVPGGSAGSGIQDSVSVTATSLSGWPVSDRITDRITVAGASLTADLVKTVDRQTAIPGDLLTYNIRYRLSGTGTGSGFRIVDPVPVGSDYHAGSLTLNGATMTDPADGDAGSFDVATGQVVIVLPTVSASDSGTVTFQVRARTVGMLTNVASAWFDTPLGPDSTASDQVETSVAERPVASLRKDLQTGQRAGPGDQVQYLLTYGNTSTQTPIVEAVLTDTLPDGLRFVSAQPAAEATGQVIRWVLGDLASGQTGTVLLTVEVASDVRDTLALWNRAVLSALNAEAVAAVAPQLEVVGPPSRALGLTKTAEVLEVGLGETAPFTLVVSNTGSVALADLVIHDRLPEGTRYATGRTGADSVVARGQDLTFYLAGPIAPGASRTIRYAVAVVSASTAVLENTAFATAESGLLRSDSVVAWIRVRPGSPMETRAVIGKVWVDLNANGTQEQGEPGLEGAEVWTDDGEVATTDLDGRFSFRNLRPGRHGFRLDPISLPMAYRVAGGRPGADLVTIDLTGWTSPRVNFRLVPRQGVVTAAWMADSAAGPLVPLPGGADVLDSLLSASRPAALLVVRLEAPPHGASDELTWPLPSGWEVAAETEGRDPAPSLVLDRDGSSALRWQANRDPITSVTLRLRPAGAAVAIEPVRVVALRPDSVRAAARSRSFLEGPGIEVFSLADGMVLALDRVFVGVRGEPGRPVALFDGDSLLGEATLRPDGVHDFVAIPLAAGPHRLRVRMENSWSNTRWDSVSVHVSGRPAGFDVPAGAVRLVADGQSVQTVSIRVKDLWDVPVITRPLITVEATGAEPVNPDEEPSSVGIQVRPDSAGWLAIRLRPGREVANGQLRLSDGDVRAEVRLEVVASAQPLLVTAVGQAGIGASPDAMAALTVRGRLDERTSIVASYDTRRLDAGRNAFGRSSDPLEEAQYPILGDASAQRTVSASQYQLSARVERGFDWLELGDVSTAGFGEELRLSGYRRALPGVAARITTGPVVWEGFGSSTSQLLRQRQIRGEGISGPYQLGGGIREGTEQVTVEVRAQENATRILSRQLLVRYIDYQIDYRTGVLLLKRPVPAADTYGNPVFIAVLFESLSGGPNSQVWGVRAGLDGRQLLAGTGLDSLRLGTTWVQETPGAGDHRLLGADLRFRRNGLIDLGAELSHAQSADSSGVALSLDGAVTLLNGAARLSGAWLSIGHEFANPSAPALRGGTSELHLAGELARAASTARLTHEWQRFTDQEAERRRTALSLRQSIGSAVQVEATAASERYQGPSLAQSSVAGEVAVRWRPGGPWSFWTEARHQFSGEAAGLRPDYVGVGAGYDLNRAVSVELRQRWALLPDSLADYSVTNLGVRSRLGFGTEAYGSYEIAGVGGAQNAALIGFRNQLRLGTAWALNALVERRIGLDRASVFDPVRAMPFLQVEESYWSAGVGAEFLPVGAPYRLSARAEIREGDRQDTRLATVAGDWSLSPSLAFLSRQELLQTELKESGQARQSHRYASLLGIAFRPVSSDALNLLAKFEWIDADQPTLGGLTVNQAAQRRTIAVVEAVWQPARQVELAGRVAHRESEFDVPSGDGAAGRIGTSANFLGMRATARLAPPVEFRVEARGLDERTSAARRYDAAPSVVLVPMPAIEVAAGYRFGTLRDPDFAVNGGPGWFVTVGARVTEGTLRSVADFWRARWSDNGGSR